MSSLVCQILAFFATYLQIKNMAPMALWPPLGRREHRVDRHPMHGRYLYPVQLGGPAIFQRVCTFTDNRKGMRENEGTTRVAWEGNKQEPWVRAATLLWVGGMVASREYLMIYSRPGFLAVAWFVSYAHPLLPPQSESCLSFSVFLYSISPVELTDGGEGGRVWARSQIIPLRETWPSIEHSLLSGYKFSKFWLHKNRVRSLRRWSWTADLKWWEV